MLGYIIGSIIGFISLILSDVVLDKFESMSHGTKLLIKAVVCFCVLFVCFYYFCD